MCTQVGKKQETDEFFSLLSELVAAVRAAAPKPKPAPKLRQPAYYAAKPSEAAQGGASASGEAVPALDPMEAKLQGFTRSQKQKPLPAALERAGSKPQPAQASPRAPGASPRTPGATPRAAAKPAPARDPAKEAELQKRLAERFERAKAKKQSSATPRVGDAEP